MPEIPRLTKRSLYTSVSKLRSYLGITEHDYPLNMKQLCRDGGLEVNEHPFKTKGLQGMLTIDDERMGYITLNANNSPCEQNFFCGHEGIHFLWHQGATLNSFQCFDTVRGQQSSIMEWQANEGAAEWLVPYQQFIPDLLSHFDPLAPTPDLCWIREILAEKYFVSERVIYNRIESLKYEIWQVANGVPINQIELLSKRQQDTKGIIVPSCNVLGAFFPAEA